MRLEASPKAVRSIIIRSDICSPGIETHARVNSGSHLFHAQVIATKRDFVDWTTLFTGMADDFGNPFCIERCSLFWLRSGALFALFSQARLSLELALADLPDRLHCHAHEYA
jgi:hypothetical protein